MPYQRQPKCFLWLVSAMLQDTICRPIQKPYHMIKKLFSKTASPRAVTHAERDTFQEWKIQTPVEISQSRTCITFLTTKCFLGYCNGVRKVMLAYWWNRMIRCQQNQNVLLHYDVILLAQGVVLVWKKHTRCFEGYPNANVSYLEICKFMFINLRCNYL